LSTAGSIRSPSKKHSFTELSVNGQPSQGPKLVHAE